MLEGETLKKLRQAGVRSIPTMVCHGEVGHEAQAPRHWSSRPGYTRSYVSYDGVVGDMKRGGSSTGSVVTSHSEGASASYGSGDYGRRQLLRRMRHYRLVVEDVCMPLECFANGRQLVSVVKDCVDGVYSHYARSTASRLINIFMIAHRDAYATRSRILHRDIGFKSIQILPQLAKIKNGTYKVEWRGTLTDWELAKSMPYIGELYDRRSRRPTRMVCFGLLMLVCTALTSLSSPVGHFACIRGGTCARQPLPAGTGGRRT